MIRKLAGGRYCIYSRKKDAKAGKRRNLGTFASKKAAQRHEREIHTSSAIAARRRPPQPGCATPSASSPRSRISGTMRSSSSSRWRISPLISVPLAWA